MTTVNTYETNHRNWPLLAVMGVGLAVVFTAVGTFLAKAGVALSVLGIAGAIAFAIAG